MKCIAIDDEPLALRQIKSYIAKTPSLELCGLFSNALDAREFLTTESVDLIFVDINMPDLSGLDFVRELNVKCGVIFTTAYAEYALDGFRLNAVDYLLKPFPLSDFQRAVGKAASLHELIELARSQESPAAAADREMAEALPEGPEFLSIKADYKTSLIRIAEIRYIESEGEYVRLHMADGNSIMTLFRLKNMESALPSESFIRIHRSFIVNLKYITSYAKGRVYLSEEEYLPIGDNYRSAFQKQIDGQDMAKK
ncbi:MAG: response regulator transcription factor [Rikenellaceae bacterium]|nr:response regulator transcription factor [Rikenellaceae bacterium]